MELLTYLGRSIVVLLLFMAVYRLFLRSDAHYSANRYFLLFGLLASFIMPLAQLQYTVLLDVVERSELFTPVAPGAAVEETIIAEEVAGVNWMGVLLYVYAAITIFFVLRLLVLFGKLLRLAHRSEKVEIEGVIICINEQVDEPFVFGNRIFLKDKNYLSPENAEILVHERVHLLQYHWVDVFVSELLIAVQWFNPLAWYYARIVKQNLEFLADQGVLKKGFKLEKYIQHIICETMGAEVSVLANHFRFSQNKRRLKMMKNDKKSKWRLLKLLLVLPVLGGLLWAFSEPVYEYPSNPELINDKTDQEKKDKFVLKGYVGETDTMKVRNPKTNTYEVKIVEAGNPLPGTSVIIKGTTTGTVADINGSFELLASEGDVLVLSFVGYNTREIKVMEGEDLYVAMSPTAYELDPSPYRAKYKGKMVPPPPPPKAAKSKAMVPPPPPPPADGDKPVFYVVEDMPSYQGGMEVYFANLYTSITQAKNKANLSGTINVQFTVNAKGGISNIKALNRADKDEAAQAVKIVSALKEWQPGVQRGKAVSTTLVVPVEFN
ncbi:carboxypeptidase-like regulatory domain-containing protein [Carboxylicivirga sediminis]|uniref:Carboxypeptidase-like regulatory domain-containing protein n=1 Tax=Carboxylicivirga sediminis TaxID=2006564 RepID=A0A941F2J4_9BACT|nr:M56 family metallopeptidase [Carboxylicivirga sediminis]MBR8534185.1 carboxypeptidase-like regulatory domain-containing protein [Carboxylicivirga sediminis]